MSDNDYHPFVPAPGRSNIAAPTPRAHAEARMQNPRAKDLFDTWAKLGAAPFAGMTTDGHVQSDLFSLQAEDAPTPAMVAAVKDLLLRLTPAQRGATSFPVDAQLWRHWQNTELYVEHHGLRLDEVDTAIQAAVMAVVRASLSGKGYEVTRDVMRLNRFLGDSGRRAASARRMGLYLLPVWRSVRIGALGLAAVRPPSVPQLLCYRPADGADAVLLSALNRTMPIPGRLPVPACSKTRSAPDWS